METPRLLWKPTDEIVNNANLTRFMAWLEEVKHLQFSDYQEVWEWSVAMPADFWESLAAYFSVIFHAPYSSVMSQDAMPEVRWFEGATLNYAEHIFRNYTDEQPAILFKSETRDLTSLSWSELKQQTASVATWLRSQGIKPGDRVCAYMPNIPEATIAFLAACSVGAIWSSCSPDFGADSVIDRFAQIEPKVIFACDGYTYNGKPHHRIETVGNLVASIPSIEQVVIVPFLDSHLAESPISGTQGGFMWHDVASDTTAALTFEAVPFAHPIWVLYSSGTTGIPKAITHSHGGCLLEHLKYLHFHNDVKPGERFFWFSTTGWMMWNFVQGSLLAGSTIVLYEGSPGYPNLNVLWELTEKAGIHHFGTSAPYIVACMKANLKPSQYNLSSLRSISSTGSPLPPEGFSYVYAHIKNDVWLASMSGGTDVCTAFVGGCPMWPVYEGEIQCRALGCAMEAWDEAGHSLHDEVGEMVVTQAMPSMPVFMWGDRNNEKYLDSYFETYPAIWRHGDWLRITPRQGLVILGRSDATLNRQGVRIGTAEIYRSVDKVTQVKDSLILNLELSGGRHFMPLFVLMHDGQALTDEVKNAIATTLKSDYSPRHVPDIIIEVADIPYTISGKKMEAPVKKILMGFPLTKAANLGSMRNPESLDFFVAFEQNTVKPMRETE